MNATSELETARDPRPVLHVSELDGAVDALAAELATLQGQLRELEGLADAKLDAIRRADAGRLEQLALDEAALLQQVLTDGHRRGALLARVAQHLPEADSERPTLGQIADRLAEPRRSRLRARSTALGELSRRLQRKNRLVGDVARNLQGHIRGVFADVASAAQETGVYGPGRSGPRSVSRSWIDAVG